MEVVTQFNAEIKSLLNLRPPISRAKMAVITKLAIKCAKLYKHIVMHVERFIAKCPPDFKVPGLYVIDSIVRQSKHQLGSEKDVFGPRFAKSFSKTFQNIFECTEDDKPKVVRVLNLWQKNGVFTPEVIQPLLSLASASNGVLLEQWQPAAVSQAIPSPGAEHPLNQISSIAPQDNSSTRGGVGVQDKHSSGPFDTTPPGVTTPDSGEVVMVAKQHYQAPDPTAMEDTPSPHTQRVNVAAVHHRTQQQLFDQALLDDFDYSDEDDDREGMRAQGPRGVLANRDREVASFDEGPERVFADTHHQPPPAILTNDPSRLRPTLPPNPSQYPMFHGPPSQPSPQGGPPSTGGQTLPPQQGGGGVMAPHGPPPPPLQGYPPFQGGGPTGYRGGPQPHPFHGGPPPPPFHGGPVSHGPPPPQGSGHHGGPHAYGPPPPHGFPPTHGFPRGPPLPPLGPPQPRPSYGPPPNPPQNPNMPPGYFPPGPGALPSGRDPHPQNYGHRSLPPPPLHGGSGPPPPFHHPPPPNPPAPSRLERSPPPSYRGYSPPSPSHRGWRERDSGERERERERDRWEPPLPSRRRSRSPLREQKSRSPMRSRDNRGSRSPPPRRRGADGERHHRKGGAHPKEEHYTVCSTTIWVGHLPKNASQSQIAESFEEFGTVKSVDVVLARGCAYVVMLQRSEAARALNSLKDLKLNGTACKLAWAPGRGVKGAAFKNYWDMDLGISFIPWEKVKSQEELDSVVEGGWIDPATCPPGMRPAAQTAKSEPPVSKSDAGPPTSMTSPHLPAGIPPVLPGPLPPPPMFPPPPPPGPLTLAAMRPGINVSSSAPSPYGAPGVAGGGAPFCPPHSMSLPPLPIQRKPPSGQPLSRFFGQPAVSTDAPGTSLEADCEPTHEVEMQLDDAESVDREEPVAARDESGGGAQRRDRATWAADTGQGRFGSQGSPPPSFEHSDFADFGESKGGDAERANSDDHDDDHDDGDGGNAAPLGSASAVGEHGNGGRLPPLREGSPPDEYRMSDSEEQSNSSLSRRAGTEEPPPQGAES